jgi:hypothetical protein
MENQGDSIRVNVNIEISGATLQKIVQTAKDIVGRNDKGHYRIDTADLLEDLLTTFVQNNGFDAYIADRDNYGFLTRKE